MPLADSPDDSRRLVGIYQDLLERERAHVDPRLSYGARQIVHTTAITIPARPARLTRLLHGESILLPHWWIGGNHYPEASQWPNYRDLENIKGWQVSADDFVVPVGHDDPRWDEPGNQL